MSGTRICFKLSRAVRSTMAPPIPEAYTWAKSFKPTKLRPLLDMSQGVPGVSPPESLRSAIASASLMASSNGYCDAFGEPSLRLGLSEEMKVVYGSDIDLNASDVALTTGCNMAFMAAIMSLADAGDEVILPVPWYFNHKMSLDLLGIRTVPLYTSPDDGFIPSIENCSIMITPRTKAIALVTPNNPTGAIYPPELLAQFTRLAKKHSIALVVDETYRDFILNGPPHTTFRSSDWRQSFVHLFSFSKSYAIPGSRLGAIVASPELLSYIKTILDCLQICPPRPPQVALGQTLPTLRSFVQSSAQAVRTRHELFRTLLPPRWKIESQGGYFAYVRHPFKDIDAKEVCMNLATKMGVLTLPDNFFHGANPTEGEGHAIHRHKGRWIRFSVANVDDEKVRRVCERLEQSEAEFGWDTTPGN